MDIRALLGNLIKPYTIDRDFTNALKELRIKWTRIAATAREKSLHETDEERRKLHVVEADVYDHYINATTDVKGVKQFETAMFASAVGLVMSITVDYQSATQKDYAINHAQICIARCIADMRNTFSETLEEFSG